MMLAFKNPLVCVVRRCSNKIDDVDVKYKLPDILKDIENRSSERIHSMGTVLEHKISGKIEGEIGKLSGKIEGEIGKLSGQVKGQSIGFGIFGALFGTIIGVLSKIGYDIIQKNS